MPNALTMIDIKEAIVWNTTDRQSRLYRADALEIMAALPAESVDCIWTDPPYNLSNDGITCVSGKMVKVNKGEWDRSRGLELDHQFNKEWLTACYRLLKPAGTIWISGTLHIYTSVGMALQEIGFRILNDIVWEKPAPPPNLSRRYFTHATEIIFWATKAKKGASDRYVFNYEAMRQENRGKQMKNVWKLMPPSFAEKRLGKHPTQKPIALVARCLRASTNPGDLVFDPFAGSGTTGVAALMEKRRFWGCERERDFVAIAVKRLCQAARMPEKGTTATTEAREMPLFGSVDAD